MGCRQWPYFPSFPLSSSGLSKLIVEAILALCGHGMCRWLRNTFIKNNLLTKHRPITLICIVAFSVLEPAKVLPTYFLVSLCTSSGSMYTSVMGRPVSVSVANAVVPATSTVYLMALMLLCMVPNIRETKEGLVADIWRLLPASVPAFVQLFALRSPAKKHQSSGQAAAEKPYMTVYYNKDYSLLADWYKSILVLSVLADTFIPASSYHEKALITGSIVAHCLRSAFQLRNLGYATMQQTTYAILAILLGTRMLGPVTVYSGLWYWRENVIYSLSK